MSEIMAQAESEARDFEEQKVRLRQRFAAGGFHVVWWNQLFNGLV